MTIIAVMIALMDQIFGNEDNSDILILLVIFPFIFSFIRHYFRGRFKDYILQERMKITLLEYMKTEKLLLESGKYTKADDFQKQTAVTLLKLIISINGSLLTTKHLESISINDLAEECFNKKIISPTQKEKYDLISTNWTKKNHDDGPTHLFLSDIFLENEVKTICI